LIRVQVIDHRTDILDTTEEGKPVLLLPGGLTIIFAIRFATLINAVEPNHSEGSLGTTKTLHQR
jgi:hypothetical protein